MSGEKIIRGLREAAQQVRPCEYLEPPDQAWEVDPVTGKETKIENPEPSLCAWAVHAGAEKLKGMPPWLVRNAEAGHWWRAADCGDCPCYTPKVV